MDNTGNVTKRVTMDDMLSSSFGEASSEITSSFKKTVLIRQYETEVVECSATVHFEKPLSGAERLLLSTLLHIQLEYSAYCDLVHKGYVTNSEFQARKKVLEDDMNNIKEKAESVSGESMDKYFGLTF